MDNTTLEDKFAKLLTVVEQLSAENHHLRQRVENLEKINNIKTNLNFPTKDLAHLSTKLIHPYHKETGTETKSTPSTPYFLVSCWTAIFQFLTLTPYQQWKLRQQCKMFRDSIQPPLLVKYPNHNYHNLSNLVTALRKTRKKKKPYPNLILLGQGDHEVQIKPNAKGLDRNYLLVDLPVTFVGEHKNSTRLVGGIEVKGDQFSSIPFSCIDVTITGSIGSGIWNTGCLPMELIRCDMSFNRVMGLDSYKGSRWKMIDCSVNNNGSTGIGSKGAHGILIHCNVCLNGNSGIRSQENSEIHLYGNKTHVFENCKRESKKQNNRSGLFTTDSSRIFIHEPLDRTCSHDNENGNDSKGGGIVVVP